ncbi:MULTISPECIES: GntR family transcriptional regulator [Streptomyces]|uniref:UbiC transcription regulator-associated n=1 Tax=Streptomyces venezuelae (strain ATCC 10712 / CBS 650.69 / DSM 40230 / JCM 4526 / NBRC 13096 / PD 04745) TaxID=953739 RepID=F2R8U2_STRVP|nr:UTRA domain-containing protein [Streptomyces venezuelae]APE22250.1 UTRA domain-containing protein [Streptomyces venezuelae]QER99633.1 UTRA domain-containing protein [Streptomyces venezuelae ATCC 10712]CCA56402.1 UbiC transcription regulator-associated [Streptomyces venezuelae ATCC 10712]
MSGDAWISETAPYLAPRKPGQSDAWTDEAARRGSRGGQRLLQAGETEAPAAVRAALGLSAAERVIVRRRLILLDGHPVELADSYYPVSVAGGTPLAEPRKVPGGAVTLLADLGYTGAEVVEDVSAALATPDEREHLGLAEGDAVLRLLRLTRTADGTPMEASLMTMPAGRHLTYRLGKQGA